MFAHVRNMGWRCAILLTGLALAGCAGRPAAVTVVPPPPLAPPAAAQPVAPTPVNAGLSAAATLWHLRTGLNVAALACRGPKEAVLVARYNALLAAQAATLKAAEAAYQAEYRVQGGDWRVRYDADQTRLYNFWGQAHGRAALCAAAGELLAEPDFALPADRLARLDRALAPPRLTVDARVFDAPAAVMVASR